MAFIHALVLGLWAVPALAQQDLAQGLSQAREGGCGGRAGIEQPLREVPALSDAARRIARGAGLQEATRAAGYRANRTLHLELSGFGSVPAIVEAVRSRYCEALLNAEFTEVGVHRQGSSAVVLLADPFSPPAAGDRQAVAERVLQAVNQARSQARRCGDQRFAAAPPLELSPELQDAAQAHAQDMARNSFMAHKGSEGSTVAQRVSRTGFAWRQVGENVAAGPQTAEDVVRGWLNSPQHCTNIMEPAFTHMGVAYAVNERSENGIYWAQVFATRR